MIDTYQLTFPEVSAAVANQYAGGVQLSIQEEAGRTIKIQRSKIDQDSQDAGAILQILATSAAVSSLASGVAKWLGRNSGATIEVELPDGTKVKVKHSGENTAESLRAIFSRNGRIK